MGPTFGKPRWCSEVGFWRTTRGLAVTGERADFFAGQNRVVLLLHSFENKVYFPLTSRWS